MAKSPKWVRRHIQTCRAAFGIGGPHDHLHLHWERVIADRPEVGGQCTTTPRYQRAVVELRDDLRPDETGYEAVTHECLHAAMARQNEAVARIIDLVPEARRDHADALWQDGNEATVTRLARALSPHLRKGK